MTALETDLIHCPLFHDMSRAECREVLELVEQKTYGRGKTILREGNSNQILWIIVRGSCRVVKSMKRGTEQVLAILEPGAVFGEMSFFHPAPHSASIKTESEVEVMRLSREKYDQLEAGGSRAAHKIALNTARVLAERLRKMDEWTCHLVEHPEAAGHREEWQEFRAKLYSDWPF